MLTPTRRRPLPRARASATAAPAALPSPHPGGARRTLLPAAVALSVATLLAAALLALAAGPAVAATGERAEAEHAFLEALDAERGDRGLAALDPDGDLAAVARGWSEEMAADGELAHNPTVATQVTLDWESLSEIVGYGHTPGASPAELAVDRVEAFMASPAHRSDILGDFDRVGVGAALDADGRLWLTAVFAAVAADAPPPAPLSASRGVAANEAAVERGLAASQATFGDGEAAHVVLARGEVFADALAGAPLAGADGPILFTPGADVETALRDDVAGEIDRVTGGQGRVYLLGGTAALSPEVAATLEAAGHDVERLAGEDRVATALEVAEALADRDGAPAQVAIARDRQWADAAVGGAWAAHVGAPVLLTPQDGLDPRVAAFLDDRDPGQRVALGGSAALAEAVVEAAGAERVAGADRSETSVAIAERLWGCSPTRACGGVHVIRGDAPSGWTAALASSAASAREAVPQLLAGASAPETAVDYVGGLDLEPGDLTAEEDVPEGVLEALRQPLR